MASITFPELAAAIQSEWAQRGAHRSATDARRDRAALHTDNQTPFVRLIGLMDALSAPQRELQVGGHNQRIPRSR